MIWLKTEGKGRINMISLVIPTLGTRPNELNRLFESIKNQTNQNYELIVVSQDNHHDVELIIAQHNLINKTKHLKLNKKGLSYSRNQGLKEVTGNIVTFSDDDCWYPDDAFETVQQQFKQNEDIICFQIFDPNANDYYKGNYEQTAQKITRMKDLFRRSSIEIFLNAKTIDNQQLTFDERFGVGTAFPSGEENIFLTSLFKKGYKVSYVPKVVVYHKKKDFRANKFSVTEIEAKGALFKRIYNTPKAIVIVFLFILMKRGLIEKPLKSLIRAVRQAIFFKS